MFLMIQRPGMMTNVSEVLLIDHFTKQIVEVFEDYFLPVQFLYISIKDYWGNCTYFFGRTYINKKFISEKLKKHLKY